MFFALLVLCSAFLIEGIGTYVSVVGLSSLFAANAVIIILAVALDVGKVVSVSFLYKHWKNIGFLMKAYMSVACVVLMLITSAGAFGFLSGEFQKAISNTNQGSVILTALTDEQVRLQSRKEEIDAQVAKLPDNMVAGRRALMKQFGPEITRLNTRLAEIDKELPKLKVEAIKKNVEVGPIIYVAEAFNTTPEHAVKWVILTIIFVFDPLAISLLLAGNYLIEQRKKNPVEVKEAESVLPPPIVQEEFQPTIPTEHEEFQPTIPTEPELDVPLEAEQLKYEFPEVDWSHDTLDIAIDKAYEAAPIPEYHVTEIPVINEIIVPKLEPLPEIIHEEIIDEHPAEPLVIADPDPVDLPVIETPIVDEPAELPLHQEAEREIVTLKQIIAPKIHRSSLEDIDAKMGDVVTDEEDRRDLRSLRKTYEDRGPAITVGGPSGRKI